MLKKRANKYVLEYQNQKYLLFEDTVIKHGLFKNKDINNDEFLDIIKTNNYYDAYYKALSYLEVLKSEKELYLYLLKKNISQDIIKEIINKMIDLKFIDDDYYTKVYFETKSLSSKEGPYKLRKRLLKKGINDEIISKYISLYNVENEEHKIPVLIDKYKKMNRDKSSYYLKKYIKTRLFNEGFTDSVIDKYLADFYYDDNFVKEKEYNKLLKKLSKKYSDDKLEEIIIQKLWQKGFH